MTDHWVAPKHAVEGFVVSHAWSGRFTGMGMNPNPAELFWSQAEIDLLIEKVGHRLIVEGHIRWVRLLLNQPNVFDQ